MASIIESMGQQDLGYKRVFAHREMVEDLLHVFLLGAALTCLGDRFLQKDNADAGDVL